MPAGVDDDESAAAPYRSGAVITVPTVTSQPAPSSSTALSPEIVLQVGAEQVVLGDDEARVLVSELLQSSDEAAAHRLAGALCRARATRAQAPVVAPASTLAFLSEVVTPERATPGLRRVQTAARSARPPAMRLLSSERRPEKV